MSGGLELARQAGESGVPVIGVQVTIEKSRGEEPDSRNETGCELRKHNLSPSSPSSVYDRLTQAHRAPLTWLSPGCLRICPQCQQFILLWTTMDKAALLRQRSLTIRMTRQTRLKSLPFVHTVCRYYPLDGSVRSSDRPPPESAQV
ncbi:unnamed protein product [Pleuronectes platessa]|uniref:Uncharacterized protein n=1 Tax=Pleuronectes platessa TaxID=8262 RepID=A0A9N7Z302_PLEPL|nr:unnamed protein product [Pleuronectes platessa]